MTIGSGLGGSVGIAAETVYGTYVAPTRFLQVGKADLKKVKTTAQGGGLAGGSFAQPGSRRVVTSHGASGGIDLEVVNSKFGLILQNIFGGADVTPTQQAATTAYLSTFNLGDNYGRSFTTQVGVPDRAGTVHPFNYLGCKVQSADFSCGVDSLLTCALQVDAQDVSETQALAAPSYPAGLMPFHFGQMAVKLGTFGGESAVSGVRKIDLKIERPMDTSAYFANSTGAKAEPVMNDWVKVSGSFDVDFVTKADFADRFASDASASLILQWTGPIIASTYAQQFTLNVPMIFLDTDTPSLAGTGVVSTTFNFTGQYDGTNSLVSATYMSTDVAI